MTKYKVYLIPINSVGEGAFGVKRNAVGKIQINLFGGNIDNIKGKPDENSIIKTLTQELLEESRCGLCIPYDVMKQRVQVIYSNWHDNISYSFYVIGLNSNELNKKNDKSFFNRSLMNVIHRKRLKGELYNPWRETTGEILWIKLKDITSDKLFNEYGLKIYKRINKTIYIKQAIFIARDYFLKKKVFS